MDYNNSLTISFIPVYIRYFAKKVSTKFANVRKQLTMVHEQFAMVHELFMNLYYV